MPAARRDLPPQVARGALTGPRCSRCGRREWRPHRARPRALRSRHDDLDSVGYRADPDGLELDYARVRERRPQRVQSGGNATTAQGGALPDLIYEQFDHSAVFTMNRPERLTALGSSLRAEQAEALNDFTADPEMRSSSVPGEAGGTGRHHCGRPYAYSDTSKTMAGLRLI